ncbi:Protein takeout [Trachymyrmex cornetzi]|uniref:Protein takeout n=1 Tax=Trachymyrmex cornetzi TaxID=471704 RepID=A0A151JLY5_9HYME|nr:Protein takeout [Trachymyrmex cornetzi]
MRNTVLLCYACSLLIGAHAIGRYRGLEFLEPCSRNDQKLEICLARTANTLVDHFRQVNLAKFIIYKNGIYQYFLLTKMRIVCNMLFFFTIINISTSSLPQLGYHEVEPIILDELHIALGGGPNGYRAQFKNITARGVSALRITGLRTRLTDDEVQLQLAFSIPRIRAAAKYRSSGTLILVQASGAGDYWGEYEDVRAKVFIRAKPFLYEGRRYLRLQQLKMDFSVKDIRMGVENVLNTNSILLAALNLFINTNSQELLKEMKPDLRRKLVQVMSSFVENLFAQVPYDAWITD